jgi:hypothetical protein
MMKRRVIIALLLAFVFVIVCLISQVPGRRFGWQAETRFRLGQVPTAGVYQPFFFQHQMQAMSNVLLSAEGVRSLANAARVGETEFRLTAMGPIRGTSLVYFRYSGPDRDGVERVASNAFVILENRCFTNQPGLEIKYLETLPYTPRTFWQKIGDEVDYWRWRVSG